MSSPFSIYILIGLTYPDYKAEPFAAYVDSGSSICLSKSACFPEEYHTDLPAIQGKDISNQNITLTKGIKHPRILISKYIVKLPLLYFHNTGCDILLGNNFLQLFKVIVQNNVSYFLRLKTPCNHWITTPRLKQAYSRKFPIPFIPRSQRGDYPIPLPLPKTDFSTPLLRLETILLKSLDFCSRIKTKLETLYVENPLQFWDNNKIYAHLELKDFPEKLSDRKQLQRFLGILNYAEGFIKNLADLRKPLRRLTSEKNKFVFTKEHEEQIRFIKSQCIDLPKLKLPLDNDDLILETDSSDSTWAAVLKRIQNNTEELCRYTSGTFSPTEDRYHINEKEFLAVIKGLKKFSYFLLPKRFLLRTDNTQVKAFIKNNLPSKPEYKRLIRWQTYCSEYIFDIDIIRSHKNVTADFLTRDGGNIKD